MQALHIPRDRSYWNGARRLLLAGFLALAAPLAPAQQVDTTPAAGPAPLPAPSSLEGFNATDPATLQQQQTPTIAPPAATEAVNPPTDSASVPPFDAGHLDSLIKQGDWTEAQRLTESYHHAPTALRLGWHYFDQGDYISSASWFDQALRWLREFPGEKQEGATVFPSATFGRAISLFKDGRVEEAEAFARQNVRVDDKIATLLADILVQRAGQLLANKEARGALNLLDEARPLRSAGFTAGEMLIEGWANYNLGWDNLQQFQKTKEAYYKEVAQPYLDNAASIFLKTFPLIDGIALESEREKTRASALEGLARTEFARGNYQEAYRIVNSPNFTGEVAEKVRAEIRAGVLAAIYGELTPEQKLQYLEGLRQRTPLTAEQTLEHGMMYLELKQFSTAARIFEYLLNQSPPPEIAARAAMGLSFASNELKDYTRARAAAEQALRLRFYLEQGTVTSLDSMVLNMDAQMAVAAYNAKDYSSALQMLDRVRLQRPLNLGERSVEAWSRFHLGQANVAYPLFENLYRDVRDVRRRAVVWDPSLPEYLRPRNTYMPSTGPDPLPQPITTTGQVPAPIQPNVTGAQPYGYTYPNAAVQPYAAPPPVYYYQQPAPAVQQPQYQPAPQQYYYPQQPAAPGYMPAPNQAPPVYGTGRINSPVGYYLPSQPQYNPRGRKHPLMQNLFDLPEGVLPPSLTEAVQQTLAESGEARGQYAGQVDIDGLYGQGDGEEPPVLNERFTKDFLKNEYGVGLAPSAPNGYPGSNTPTAYQMPPQQNAPAPAGGGLPSFETLTGQQPAAPTYTLPPAPAGYTGQSYSNAPIVANGSPFVDPNQQSGAGYYPTQTQAPATSPVSPQFDNLLKSLSSNQQQQAQVPANAYPQMQPTVTYGPSNKDAVYGYNYPQPFQGSAAATTTAQVPAAQGYYPQGVASGYPMYTVMYTTEPPEPEVRRQPRPVIVEPDITLPGEPYVPKLADLAKGVYSSAAQSDQLARAKLFAQEVGGPMAAEVAEGLRARKLYLEVQKTFLASEPNLENYDTGRLTGAVRMRSKSGTSGLGELNAIQFPVITYEGYSPFNSDKTRFAAEAGILYLDSGGRDAAQAFGRFPEEAPERIDSESQEDPVYDFRIKFWEEDWTSRFIEIGMSPINGPVDATPIGRIGLNQNTERGYWRAEVFRESKKESVLSWIGEVDPYSGEAWGRVTETGVSGEFLWALKNDGPQTDNLFQDNDISVFGKGTVGFLSGEGVAENTHLGVTLAIQRSFETDRLDYLLGGIGFSAEHYEKNLSQFTYGHGGYFSPQMLLQAQVFMQFMTHEGLHHLISGQAAVGFQTNDQDETPFFPLAPDGRVYPSERQTSSIAQGYLTAAFLLDPQWKFTVQAGAAATATYDEFFGGFLFTYYFEPRKGLYSSDLATPFVNQ
jgi:hypothetical protein